MGITFSIRQYNERGILLCIDLSKCKFQLNWLLLSSKNVHWRKVFYVVISDLFRKTYITVQIMTLECQFLFHSHSTQLCCDKFQEKKTLTRSLTKINVLKIRQSLLKFQKNWRYQSKPILQFAYNLKAPMFLKKIQKLKFTCEICSSLTADSSCSALMTCIYFILTYHLYW